MVMIAISATLLALLLFMTYRYERKVRQLAVQVKELRKHISYLQTVIEKKKETINKPRKLRKRYIVFAVLSSKGFSINKKTLEKAIRECWEKLLGELSLVKADPQLIYFDPSVQRGVLRVAHIYKDEALAVLGIIKKINEHECLLIPLKTAGTIKKARKIMYSLRRDLQK